MIYRKLKEYQIHKKLSKDEFDEMLKGKEKGIISYKASKNDNITALALLMTNLFILQRKYSSNPQKQSTVGKYLQANAKAGELLEEMEKILNKSGE